MSGPAKPALLILAGGKGTRLATLDSTRPKPMVLVAGKPFLHWLVDFYRRQGYRDFIFSTGHLAEVVESYDWDARFPGATFASVRETTPLGPGGAVRMIFEKCQLDAAWVLNGDTLLPQPLPAVDPRHEAIYSVLEKDQLFDATPNLVVEGELVVAERAGGHYFDGGAVYVTNRAVARYQGPVPCSIHGLLKPAMDARRVGFGVVPGTCYDIGTPERYKRFESFIKDFSKC
ncbi:MAG: NTP transferase domain-containing protein [Deltaproteobacteria bacterium]|nr:NTP transferase domain-containing protein [Deltaproteobacteria bacterium]